MRAILVDDEELALEVMERLLSQIEGITITGRYTNPHDVLRDVEKLNADVVFLDLEMGSLHGLILAEKLNSLESPIEIVFVTAHAQFALEAFEVNAIDYLLKPINFERLQKTVVKLKKRQVKLPERYVKTEDNKKICIYVLGHYQVFDEKGEPMKWRTKKVKELFAYLWHQKNQPVTRYRIIESLWTEIAADKAAVMLHTTVYQLRKILKEAGYPKAILYSNEQYVLNFPYTSDLQELEKIIKYGTADRGDLDRLLSLYEGDYLIEEEYRWSFFFQQELKRNYFQFLEEQAKRLQSENLKDPLAEKILIKILEADYYNEDYLYLLLKYYYQCNNKGKFIFTFEKSRLKIREELGINLSSKVLELYYKFTKDNLI